MESRLIEDINKDLFGLPTNGAEFSEDGKYRYKLWRVWDTEYKPVAMCIGLNPSTANSDKDDPTIRTLTNALHTLGYGGFFMTNLFGWISSQPSDLLTVQDPLGDNDAKLDEVRRVCREVIFCWGTFEQAIERIEEVAPRFPGAKCFGVNANGSPWHPLSLMYRGATKNPQLIDYKYDQFK